MNDLPHEPISRRRLLAATALAAGAAGLALPGQAFAAGADMKAIRSAAEAGKDASVKRLQDWIRHPGIAAEKWQMEASCDFTMGMLRDAGFQMVSKVPTDGQPGIFATLDAGAKRTVGLYFMYDVKQVNPAEWTTPPFEAALVDKPGFGRCVVGRGAVNQKGPETAFLGALHAIRAAGRKLPVNLVLVVRETIGKVAILRLNRPETLNAIGTLQDCDDLVAAIDAIGDDRRISAMILTGNGRAFSAGGNLKAMQDKTGIGPMDQPDGTRANYRRGVQRITRALLDCEVPAIAAINGHAVGLGCDLACLCDIRLAGQSALFACSFIKVGLVPGDGGAWSLARVVGYAMAAELFFTGDRFDAARARDIGLVSRVVADAELMTEALALAQRIAANPARALRLTKRLLREAQTARMSEILELSAAFQALAHETSDHKEAVAAFLEKRAPVFTGG